MKKFLAMLLPLVLCISCAFAEEVRPESILEEIFAASTNEALLDNAERVAGITTVYYADGSVACEYRYADAEIVVYEDESTHLVSGEEECFGWDDQTGEIHGIIYMDDAWVYDEWFFLRVVPFFPEETELVTDIHAEGGLLYVSTQYTEGESRQSILEEAALAGYEVPENAEVACLYVVDAETLLLREMQTMLLTGEDASILLSDYRLLSEPDAYEIPGHVMQSLRAEPSRTVTVITDPGRPYEKMYTCVVGADCRVAVKCSDQHSDLYTDILCTQLLQGVSGGDLTLYAPLAEGIELAQCDRCGGWFETGNIFRNHICNP